MSDARQLLRDYAREEVTTTIPDNDSGDYELVVGQRGELAGKAFQALQGAMTEAETWQHGSGHDAAQGILSAIAAALGAS